MFPLVGFVILAYHAQAVLSAPATYDQRQTGDLNVQVHVKDLQIVAFIDSELLEDYTDYDYFYDYADFTVKPTGGTPTTPNLSSVNPGSTLSSNGSFSESSPEHATTESSSSSSQNVSESVETQNVTEPIVNVEHTSVETSNSTIAEDSSTENSSSHSATESTQALEDVSSTTVKYRINDKAGNLFDAEDILLTSKDTSSEAESPLVQERPVPEQQSRKRCRSGYTPDGKGRCRRFNRRRVSFVPIAMKLAPTSLANDRNHATAAI